MIVPDVNLLLYATDETSPFFERAHGWWSHCLNGREPVGLCHVVLFAFLRLSTNPRVFEAPLRLEEAEDIVQTWLDRRVTRVLLPEVEHHERVLALLRAAGATTGHLVTDAQIASLAVAHRGEVHTADQDFRRFPDVRCRYPLV